VDICLLQLSRPRISHPVIALLEPIPFVARQICNLLFALENVLGTFKIMQNDVFRAFSKTLMQSCMCEVLRMYFLVPN